MVESIFKEDEEQGKSSWLGENSGCVVSQHLKTLQKVKCRRQQYDAGRIDNDAEHAVFACQPNT